MLRRIALVASAALVVAYAPPPVSAQSADWSRVDLGTLGGSISQAHVINDRGQVVGHSMTATGQRHAFLWEDGVMTDLGTLPGSTNSNATGINNRGQVVGGPYFVANSPQAFLWQDGEMTDLGGGWGAANGINNRGQIVGRNDSLGHAVMWTR